VTTDSTPPRHASRAPLISLGLILATLLVYGQTATREFDFLRIDDPDYVTANPHVTSGFTLDGLKWAITSLDANNWHPLTWISLQLDCQFLGVDPRAFHLVNALLHAANSVLLFLVLRRMTGAEWCSAAVAAFFALHPAHVESVAWITERKDVLSALFWMLTTLAYVWYAERPGVGRYLLMLLTFALGLTAKPMLVTLPATLLLFDYWPLRRWGNGGSRFARASLGRLVLEKLPLFALVVATIPLTIRAQAGVAKSLEMFPLNIRVANALIAYVRYIGMLFWPVDLTIFYPHPRESVSLIQAIAAAAVLVAITCVTFWQWRRRPYLIVGWLWFLGTLVPVIGLMQVGMQALADRYTYIPYIGLFIMLAWGVADATAGWVARARPLAAGCALVLAAWAVLSFQQVRRWRDTETLWRHNLDVTHDDGTAHQGLGLELLEDGRPEEARDHLLEAIRLGRHMSGTHGGLGLALERLGDLDGAAQQYRIALSIEPDSAPTHFGLGRVREAQGRYDDAREQFEAGLRKEPNLYVAHRDLANVLKRLGNTDEALAEYDRAIALAHGPELAEAHNNKGVMLESLGRLPEALESYRQAVHLDSGQFIYRCNLAYALHESGQIKPAEVQYREAARLRPDWPQLAAAEAWHKATHPDAKQRNGTQALRLAKQVVQATGSRFPQALDVLAASYAEVGKFDEAVATERRLLESAPSNTPPELLKEFRDRLTLYEKGQPYRQP
jgi:tetratricopeptide (TPR) repeat protein